MRTTARGTRVEEKTEMRENTENKKTWTLTVLRHGQNGSQEDIEKAEFRFGRWSEELEESPVSRLPSGLVSVLQHSGMEEQALEAGFLVEMLPHSTSKPGWNEFIGAARVTQLVVGPYGPTRAFFVSPDDCSTLEFVDVCCPFHSESDALPPLISVRALELPMATMAWAFDNGIFECDAEQLTLDQWVDFSEMVDDTPKELPMPGPPEEPYKFI